MAKTSVTKLSSEETIVDESTVVDVLEKKMDENKSKNTKKSINAEPLNDFDEIEVVSIVPNVSYKDSKTLDMYEWDKVGHVEIMTFDVLKNMWRSNKGYFKNMWLKPKDDRVINKFGLTKTYEKYEFLMNESNYVKKNIDIICSSISDTPNGLKFAICDKIKNMVINGVITDVHVIKALEKHLGLELIDFL